MRLVAITMATKKTLAPDQDAQAAGNVGAAVAPDAQAAQAGLSQEEIAKAAQAAQEAQEAKDKARADVLSSVTFSEGFKLISRAARWNDVLEIADAFHAYVHEAGYSIKGDATPAKIARKAATIAPTLAMQFRFALASYSLSGRTANAQQMAELAGKLPELKVNGQLRDKAVMLGSIVLPPLTGEI
jgi:hypothetical protein